MEERGHATAERHAASTGDASDARDARRRRPVARRRVRVVLGRSACSVGPLVRWWDQRRPRQPAGPRSTAPSTASAERPPPRRGETILMVGTRPGGPAPTCRGSHGEQSVEAVMLDRGPAGRCRPGSSRSLPLRAASCRRRAPAAAQRDASPPSRPGPAARRPPGRDRLADLRPAGRRQRRRPDATRYGSRPAVQHDFLRAVLEGTLHAELRKQPLDLYRALSTTADGTAVDDEWSVVELDGCVFSLRNLRSPRSPSRWPPGMTPEPRRLHSPILAKASAAAARGSRSARSDSASRSVRHSLGELEMAVASVIIPAHNEAATIGRNLRALREGTREGDLDVVVVCNGCTDQHRRRRAPGRPARPRHRDRRSPRRPRPSGSATPRPTCSRGSTSTPTSSSPARA